MPVHDWTRVDAGLFHAFHQTWSIFLCGALNKGVLPRNYFALPEQPIKGPIPDVLTLRLASEDEEGSEEGTGGLAVATAPPRSRLIQQTDEDACARKANRITVRHRHGKVVAVIEIVSPGNKAAKTELRAFVEKSADLIRQHVHLLVIDLFPPGKRDPQGIHKAIWEQFKDQDFDQPADKPLTVASYSADVIKTAYVEWFAVGDPLPDMPLFLEPERYVLTPLEASYQAAWQEIPEPMQRLLER